MKTIRLAVFSFLLAAAVVPLAAQTKPAEPTRIAYVDSEAFVDEATGIKKLVKVLKDLERQFQAQQTEMVDMTNRLNTLSQELNQLRANPPADPKVASAKYAEAQQLQKTMKQKGDVAQAAYNKKSKEVRGPVEAEIGHELPNFIKERGISVLLDSARLGGAMLAANPNLNVTADFIAYFNAKHP